MAITTLALRRPISKSNVIIHKGRKMRRVIPTLTLRNIHQRYNRARIIARGAQKLRGRVMMRSPAKNLQLSKKNNNTRKRIQGFQITRSSMINWGQCKQNSSKHIEGVIDPWATNTLKFHGAGMPLVTRIETGRDWTIDQGGPHLTGAINFIHQGSTAVVFCPQWPGAKADRNDALQLMGGAPDQIRPNFGVKPNHSKLASASQKDNYQFNNIAVDNMFGLFDASSDLTPLTNTTYSFTGNVLNVMNSYVTIDLFNPNPRAPVDVHIFTVFQKTKSYQDATGSCSNELPLNELLYRLGTGTGANNHNAFSNVIVDLIRKGKLPSKLFKVLKHRVCHLGCRPQSASTSPNYKQNGPETNRKVIKMKFAGKKFYRQYCTTQSDLFNAAVTLEENYSSIQKVIMIALPSQTQCLTSTDEAGVAPSPTIFPVWYKINKTNIWTVQGNY